MQHLRLFGEMRARFRYQRRLVRQLGWRFALRSRIAKLRVGLGWQDNGLVQLHPANLLYPITLRLGSSDADAYGQVLVDEEYAALADGCAAEFIVDCGANIGLTSAYLLSRFPHAHVVAIEPFAENAALCRRNLAPYGSRARVIEGAVWSRCTRLVLEHTVGDEWGVRVRAAQPEERGQIDAIDLPSLGLDRIDILKLDIEGSEAELFANGADRWLPRVSNIAIELHGAECEQRFRTAIAAYQYTESQSGELTICRGITRRADNAR